MIRIVDTMCHTCDKVFVDVIVDSDSPYPDCCGAQTRWLPTRLHTTEWGSPRHYPHIRDAAFGSRSELAAYAKENHMALGASAEKVHGARNEDHLNTGKRYSYAGSPKG